MASAWATTGMPHVPYHRLEDDEVGSVGCSVQDAAERTLEGHVEHWDNQPVEQQQEHESTQKCGWKEHTQTAVNCEKQEAALVGNAGPCWSLAKTTNAGTAKAKSSIAKKR